jgi:hypothetical protein
MPDMNIPRKGFQRGMRFLRWANEATQEEIDAAIKPKAQRPQRCYRCQAGRGLHLCGSCAVTVKSIFRRYTRESRKRRDREQAP